jgi:cytochrome P450
MPASLQAIGWARRPLPFMERCRKRYGETFTLRIRHAGTWVFLCDPEDVRTVFTADPGSLSVGEANTLLGPLLGPRSVMLLEEPAHMTHRKRMLRSFHGRYMEHYRATTAQVAREALASWPLDEPLQLWPRMQAITLEVIMRAVFGAQDSDALRRLRGLLGELTDWTNDPRRLTLLAALGPRWVARNPSFRSVMGSVEAALLDEVRRRRAQPQNGAGENILSMLEQAHREEGSPLSERELRDELITLLSDGPTSTSLAWVFERLLRHPDKLARLREELCAGEDDAYLEAVLKETLRLCPPVPVVVRRLREPMLLGGHLVPAGTMVAPCTYLIHRREDIYPQPRSFMPERFLHRQPGTYTWIPFGGGVRRCLAASFALLEMREVVRTVLTEVDLHPVRSRSEQVARGSIAFVPNQRGLAVVTRREPLRRAA